VFFYGFFVPAPAGRYHGGTTGVPRGHHGGTTVAPRWRHGCTREVPAVVLRWSCGRPFGPPLDHRRTTAVGPPLDHRWTTAFGPPLDHRMDHRRPTQITSHWPLLATDPYWSLALIGPWPVLVLIGYGPWPVLALIGHWSPPPRWRLLRTVSAPPSSNGFSTK